MCFSGICIYKIDDGCAFLSKLVHFSADVNGTAFICGDVSALGYFHACHSGAVYRGAIGDYFELFVLMSCNLAPFLLASFILMMFLIAAVFFLRLCLLAPVILTRIYIRAKDTCTHKFTDEGSV